jgi:hypothetical protein
MQVKVDRSLFGVLKPVPQRPDLAKLGVDKDLISQGFVSRANALQFEENLHESAKEFSPSDVLLAGWQFRHSSPHYDIFKSAQRQPPKQLLLVSFTHLWLCRVYVLRFRESHKYNICL